MSLFPCGIAPIGLYFRVMELYLRQTQQIIARFLAKRLSSPHCIAALDAALADLIPRLMPDQVIPLRHRMLENNAVVMAEMERRGPPD
jgi:hypothetical protein